MTTQAAMRIVADDPRLGHRGVELWRVDLDAAREPPDEAVADLDDAERERLARYRQVGDRARFAGLRSALRRILGHRMGRPPRAVPIEIGPHGRPYVAGDPVAFSLAHSGHHGLIAISATAPVGVDVEQARPLDRVAALAGLVLSPAERTLWLSRPVERREALFLQAWTAKEAVLKAMGIGLLSDPTALSVLTENEDLSPRGSVAGRTLAPGDVLLRDLPAPSGYVAALAVLMAGSGHAAADSKHPIP